MYGNSVKWSKFSFLYQVLSEDSAGELMPIVAGAVFTLTAHLSQSVLSEQQQGAGLEGGSSSGFASIANSALHLILRKLLDFILCTGGGFQRLRTPVWLSALLPKDRSET